MRPNLRHVEIGKKVRELIGSKSNFLVLDCGCGRGQVLSLLDGVSGKVIGCDTDPEMVKCCRDRGREAYFGDIRYLPFEDRSVDVLVCSEVVEHLDFDSLVQASVEMKRVLVPGGFLIITTPEQEKDILKDPKHKRLVTLGELRRLFGSGKYELMEKNTIYKSEKCRKANSGSLFVIFGKKIYEEKNLV